MWVTTKWITYNLCWVVSHVGVLQSRLQEDVCVINNAIKGIFFNTHVGERWLKAKPRESKKTMTIVNFRTSIRGILGFWWNTDVHHLLWDHFTSITFPVITIWRSEYPQRPERFYYLSLSQRRWNPILPVAVSHTHHQVLWGRHRQQNFFQLICFITWQERSVFLKALLLYVLQVLNVSYKSVELRWWSCSAGGSY